MRSLLLLVLAIVLSLLAGPVHAQSEAERQAARTLGEEALKLYESHDYEAAYDRFDKANRLLQAPTLELYMARSQLRLGKLASAYDHFRRGAEAELAADAPSQFVDAQQEARAALAKLEPRVPTLQVTVAGAGEGQRSLMIDGQPVTGWSADEPLRLDPGEHSVEVSAPGFESAVAIIRLTEGDAETLELALQPRADGEVTEEGILWPAIVAHGVGAFGLALGVITGVMATSEADDIKSRCADNHCLPEDEAQGDEAEVLAGLSTVGFVLAGAGAVAGVVLTVWRLSDPSGSGRDGGPSAVVKLAPGYVGLTGTF